MLLARRPIMIVGAIRANSLAAGQTFRSFPAFAIAGFQRGKAITFFDASMKEHLSDSALAQPPALHRARFHSGIGRVVHVTKVHEAGDQSFNIRGFLFAPAALGNLASEVFEEFRPRRGISSRIV